MCPNEFSIIEKWFKPQTIHRDDVRIGIGDDAAIVQVPSQQHLVISTDTLIANVHFSSQASPFDIGYKALAVNLSDIAAMAAEPVWVSLALTMPQDDEAWLTEFTAGFFSLCREYHMQLIGGDLTQGPLAITVTIHGVTSPNHYLLRSTAQVGDLIYVTGTLGDAGFALQNLSNASDFFKQRLHRPQPRVKEALSLRDIANAAIDISDGLAADLQHILDESHVGASVQLQQLPLSKEMRSNITEKQAWELALTSGDDYELCFTVPKEKQALLEKQIQQWNIPCTCIGVIESKQGLRLYQPDRSLFALKKKGYQHFEC